jgi:RNA-directed DNA polymerase
VISPLLANIGLHGLEEFIYSIPYRKKSKLGIVRYADDFIITARSKEEIQIAKAKIEEWMKSRNLELSTEKTSIKKGLTRESTSWDLTSAGMEELLPETKPEDKRVQL